MDNNYGIEEAVEKLQIAMMYINEEIIEMIKDTGLDNFLTREQIETIRIIQVHEKLSIKKLARYQNIYMISALKRVRKLEKLRYVTRIKTDKKIKLVRLTTEGEFFAKQITSLIMDSVIKNLNDKFTKQEMIYFVELLDYISAAIKKANN